ncbi:MAG: hypothetical protein HC870_03310 [Rhizobiales bacterium]|nr:hypothetical protein [Hyphomicrobiales bacterium]
MADTASPLVSEGLDPVIEPAAPDVLVMSFGEVARFRIGFDDKTIRLISTHPKADQDTIDHLVDDHIAPRIIAAGGDLVLHGSACVIDGCLAVFLGQTGSGKSTLAASMHADGHRLLGDDAVVISVVDGVFHGESVYPSLRLYRESIDQVFRDDVRTTAMAFYSDKLHVAADNLGDGTGPQRYPIGAIYILTEGDAGVMLDRFVPADACMALVENSFALDPHDPVAAAQRMAKAASVAAATACYELAYPYDFGLLGEAARR